MQNEDIIRLKEKLVFKQSKHFQFFFSQNNAFFVESIIDNMEKLFVKMNKLCKSWSMDEIFEVFCVDNVEDYLTLTHIQNHQPWMRGYADRRNKRISLLRQNTPEKSTEEYLKIFRLTPLHELVHLVFNKLYPNTINCQWISEGTATHYSGQLRFKKVDAKNFPTIQELGKDFVSNHGYTYGGVYVRFLIKMIGEQAFVAQYATPAKLHYFIYDVYQSQKSFEEDAIADFLKNAKSNV